MKNANRLLACGTYILALLVGLVATPSAEAQTFTTLHSFDFADGSLPNSALVQATDGNLYGTTASGGAGGVGTVFKIAPSGTQSTIYSFCSEACGEVPYAGLIQGTDGNFYGTTYGGGARFDGTVFKVTSGGTLTTLYSFCSLSNCADGEFTYAPLVQGTDGNFYGTTYFGGVGACTYGCGTAFKITPGGTLTTLHSFCSESGCTDGSVPAAGLAQAADGHLYGTTTGGGANGGGTVFKITASGTLTTLYSFCPQGGRCTDGQDPYAGVLQATDGNFYGTTLAGGANNSGTVFKITPGGTLTTLYSFCSQSGCTDGNLPFAALIQATDGNFYGTTDSGGNGVGTVFKVTPGGTLMTLHSFDRTDGANPIAGVIQDTNGNFYGTADNGGANGDGTVFSLSVGLGPFVETQRTSGKVGMAVKILGTNLTGATGVTFNGTAATFTVVASSLITTTVPAGATTGTVQVVTPSGTLSSNVPFRVLP